MIPVTRRWAGLCLWAVGGLCVSCSGGEVAQTRTEPTTIEGHEVLTFDEYGANEHVQGGDVHYRQSPPVSGPHAPVPAACGLQGEGLIEEEMVHTLEHGAVGILFEPKLATDEIRAIERFVEPGTQPVFSAPYEGLEKGIAVVAWGRRMDLRSFDPTAVEGFIEAFAGEAPEGDMECSGFAKDSFVD